MPKRKGNQPLQTHLEDVRQWLCQEKNRIFPCFCMGILLLACSGYFVVRLYEFSKSDADSLQTGAAVTRWEEYLQDLFVSMVQEDELSLHYTLKNPEDYGIEQADEVHLGHFSEESLRQKYDDLKQLRIELLNFDSRDFNAKERLTYDILLDWVQTNLEGEPYLLYEEQFGSVTGTQAQLPILLAEYSIEDEEDILRYFSLLESVDDYLMEMLAFEQQRTQAGLGMTDAEIDCVVEQSENFAEQSENCYLISSFQERLETLDGLKEEEKQTYEETNQSLVETQVLTGYRQLADGLALLKTGTDGGLCRLPEGKAYYSWLVRQKTGSEKSVEEWKEAIYERLQANFSTMQTIYSVQPDAAEDAAAAVFSLTEPSAVLEDLKKKIFSSFPEAAHVSYEVKSVPTSMQEHLSPAFYIIPCLDDFANNTIYINDGKLGYGAEQNYSVLAHEGYPGHLYQTTYFRQTDPYEIRSLLNYSGYIEGWATYAEQYAYSLSGDFTDEVSLLKENSSTVTLAFYALMDLGIHYDGWTREDLENFVKTYFQIQESDIINQIYDMILENPAGYLEYYGGYLEIMELKEEMTAAWGDDFSDKRFHQRLLELGPCSFAILRRNMD